MRELEYLDSTDDILNDIHKELFDFEEEKAPYISQELMVFLLSHFKDALRFDRDTSHEDYLYNCGIVEVLQFLLDEQKKGKD